MDKQINGITKFKFKHKSGGLSCAPIHPLSNFGCVFGEGTNKGLTGGFATVISRSRTLIAPQYGYDKRIKKTGYENSDDTWLIDG